MGGSGKWVKSLIGLKKSEKDDQVTSLQNPLHLSSKSNFFSLRSRFEIGLN